MNKISVDTFSFKPEFPKTGADIPKEENGYGALIPSTRFIGFGPKCNGLLNPVKARLFHGLN